MTSALDSSIVSLNFLQRYERNIPPKRRAFKSKFPRRLPVALRNPRPRSAPARHSPSTAGDHR